MVKLYALALLLCEGFDVEKEYQNVLDELFLNNPDNQDLLELEEMSGNIKSSVSHVLLSKTDEWEINYDLFGKYLMKMAKFCYEKTELKLFAKRMYFLWQKLPSCIQEEEPFFTLCFAGDPLSYGDTKQTRELYENMFDYYNE